jgi:hypothetical protein
MTAITKKKHISELHFEHKLLKAKLNLYNDELAIYANRLAEISAANTDTTIKQKVEQFQNRFIIQKNENDKLQHEINLFEDQISDIIKENPVAWDHKLVENHDEFDAKVLQYDRLFRELKQEFSRFAADNL